MRQISHSIKFFAGSQVSTKKMDEESRFGELSTEERQEIVDNPVPVTPKSRQSSRLFNGAYQLSFH